MMSNVLVILWIHWIWNSDWQQYYIHFNDNNIKSYYNSEGRGETLYKPIISSSCYFNQLRYSDQLRASLTSKLVLARN